MIIILSANTSTKCQASRTSKCDIPPSKSSAPRFTPLTELINLQPKYGLHQQMQDFNKFFNEMVK